MQTGTFTKMFGHVEVDETYIGGKARFHLFRYLDEQTFRFNTRNGTDADRFVKAAAALTGRRLPYSELIGKGTETGTSH